MSAIGDAVDGIGGTLHAGAAAIAQLRASLEAIDRQADLLAEALGDNDRPEATEAIESARMAAEVVLEMVELLERADAALKLYLADAVQGGQAGAAASTASPGSGGRVRPGGLAPHEIAQAEEIVRWRGGQFVGVARRAEPGIDGHLDGEPISLKVYDGMSPVGVLTHAHRAEVSASNSSYRGIDLYIQAERLDRARMLDFAANGPLVAIPRQGIIRTIYVKVSDGWITIPGDVT